MTTDTQYIVIQQSMTTATLKGPTNTFMLVTAVGVNRNSITTSAPAQATVFILNTTPFPTVTSPKTQQTQECILLFKFFPELLEQTQVAGGQEPVP